MKRINALVPDKVIAILNGVKIQQSLKNRDETLTLIMLTLDKLMMLDKDKKIFELMTKVKEADLYV